MSESFGGLSESPATPSSICWLLLTKHHQPFLNYLHCLLMFIV